MSNETIIQSPRRTKRIPTKDHPSIHALLRWFAYDHLPHELRQTSKGFHALAHQLVEHLPVDPETTVALRKLLEAKDAAVRARQVQVLIDEHEAKAQLG